MESKRVPMRRCVGCMVSKPKSELIQIVYTAGKILTTDTKASGRSVYLCPDKNCISTAKKRRGFNRSLKREIPSQIVDEIFERLENDAR